MATIEAGTCLLSEEGRLQHRRLLLVGLPSSRRERTPSEQCWTVPVGLREFNRGRLARSDQSRNRNVASPWVSALPVDPSFSGTGL